ncbi:BQ2448_728 [Microbotryum intermedium]|uniref:mannose-1-phosphate guanylyltransferase n=1 Tax=Microbotryum intermedium TaxID=269621 RepID=A0A238F664_9BASI|nr:BQ2448_728 [Microbotryum intermedium]
MAPFKGELKALILVGQSYDSRNPDRSSCAPSICGFGTRLRPLTLTLPKPLVPFANQAMIIHHISALAAAGVKHIVLAVNYRPEVMSAFLAKVEKDFDVKITFSIENEPLGTGGPLALARNVLAKDDAPFFVLNSDVTCQFAFQSLLDFHLNHSGEGTILVTKVEEPSKYGVVLTHPGESTIERFVEKPKEFVGNRINAGIYIFNPAILERIEVKPTSIESEIFPAMAADRELHCMDLEGFWMDIGQPKDFLSGTCLYLTHLSRTNSPQLTYPSQQPYIVSGNVLIDPSATIDPTASIGPNVVIGPGVVVGKGVRLQRCVIMENTRVKDHAWIQSSIVGWNSTIGRWARLENTTVLGDDVQVGEEVYVNGASVLPHKSIKANISEPSIVM